MAEQLELFPTEVGYELSPQEELQQEAGNIELNEPIEATPILDAEWCFQFFDNEPIVFAWTKEGAEGAPMVINIDSVEGQGISFNQNGMSFRIFPKPISEKTKLERKKENQK
jgi:hypothetical protein